MLHPSRAVLRGSRVCDSSFGQPNRLMSKVCTHGRDKKVAMQQLEESLKRLGTDHLDLWQIHEVIYENDPDLHFAKGGLVEALDEAKKQGKVRAVAALAAGAVVVVGHVLHYPSFAVMIVGALLCFWLRVMAILRGWHLPVAGTPPRPD